MAEKLIGGLMGLCLAISSGVAFAADAEVAGLRAALREMRSELDAYKAKLDALDAIPAAEAKESWADKLKVFGDFRYRHEYFNIEGADEDRHRHRIRARLGVAAQVQDDLKMVLRLATGGDDPVSTNQTLDGAFSSKTIVLDQAYMIWSPEVLGGVNIHAGKMAAPFHTPMKSQLIWDGDLTFEGIALSHVIDRGESRIFANGGLFWVDERADSSDTLLYGGQIGAGRTIAPDTSIRIGGSYYYYSQVDGCRAFYDDEDAFGNSAVIDPNGNGRQLLYTQDYHLVEGFAELETKAAGLPIAFFADYVLNTEADSDDTGYMLGARLGKASKPGEWEVTYNYRKVEADAVVGLFTDSDFRGGGTDGKGHQIGVGYALGRKLSVAATYFICDAGIDNGKSYERGQVDLMFKF